MSEIATRTFAQAFADARGIAWLNESDTTEYSDAKLLPVAAFVVGEIQDEFAKHSLPKHETTTQAVSYVANASSIVLTGITDFGSPLEIWEKATAGDEWTPMAQVGRLVAPPQQAPSVLGEWEWSDGVLKVNPCTAARSLLIRYRRTLAYAVAGAMPGEEYYWAIVAGVAHYACMGTERSGQADRFERKYQKRILDALIIAVKDRQAISIRPTPSGAVGARRITIASS